MAMLTEHISVIASSLRLMCENCSPFFLFFRSSKPPCSHASRSCLCWGIYRFTKGKNSAVFFTLSPASTHLSIYSKSLKLMESQRKLYSPQKQFWSFTANSFHLNYWSRWGLVFKCTRKIFKKWQKIKHEMDPYSLSSIIQVPRNLMIRI